eukprot:CAMPEP_0196579992 /NCGR_PEP_ID=MMETSP1081-20130531/26171_1 /TAXON_ID=36882 /ORGANISM="Pyramimonas amylifera, Strain CCMP720" /LENGTH=52 /DNA_ID=CAMNT_0041899739 /DNA_START=115 /DNA_END=273 /DNA_ORIENTATION=+
MPNRGPVTLSIDEVDRILDLLPQPDADEDKEIKSIRTKFQALLLELQKGAVQ